MGEFNVHRVRFFNYVPSGIRCVAYNNQSNRLAVSRTDGTVEIYNLSANYFQEKFFPGHESRATEALCWAKGQRLFSAGLNGEIIEYDLQELAVKYAVDAFGGPIWSMAASPSGSQLLVGCEDGSVKLFQITPDRIQFERNFDRQKSRILSLSWHPAGTRVAAGSIDYISVFDAKSGSAIGKMLVDRQYMGVSKRKCIIWGVAFLSDGTVISVDSAGKVQIWDSATGTLVKNHLVSNADVQSIAVSDQEDSFVVGTAEGTVFHFQLVSVTSSSSEKQWVRTKPFQHHTHDVRAVAHSPTALISGGTDTHLVIRPLMEKVEVKNYDAALRKITFPHRRLVSCAKKKQLLLFQFAHHLELWRLGSTVATGKNGDTLPLSKNADHLLHLKTKGPENIICSSISPCGGWIACSTASRFFLYRLNYEHDDISLQRVSKMPVFLRSALQILFAEDSTKLFVASNQGSLHVIRLLEGGFKHLHTFQPQSGTVQSMCLLAVSPDGSWLAASGTSAGVHVYNVKQLKLHCTVPAYNFPVTALAIAPNTNNLVIAHSDQQVFEYSIPDKQYTEWSRAIQKQGFHHLWLQRDTPITHISFHPKRPMHILLPQDLCPLYRPGEWEDLASEKDINPFSKFKSLNKEKRQQSGERTITSDSTPMGPSENSPEYTETKPSDSSVSDKVKELQSAAEATQESTAVAHVSKEPSDTRAAFESVAKENSLLGEDDDFVDLEELSSQTKGGTDKRDTSKECLSLDPEELRKTKSRVISSTEIQSALNFSGTGCDAELKGALDLETCEKQDMMPEVDKRSGSPESQMDNSLNIHEDLDKVKLIEYYLNKNKEGSQLPDNVQKAELSDGKSTEPVGIDITLSSSLPQTGDPPIEGKEEPDKTWAKEKTPLPLQLSSSTEESMNKEYPDSSLEPILDNSGQGAQMDNKSEVQLWLLKRIQVPIEDILPSKEEKSKTPPMFLCIKVGKPMRKSFATHTTAVVQQYGKRRKQPEYWFAVPRERVDHLYTFFVQWSPDVYGKDAKEQGFVVVEKEELNMIDNFFSEPTTKSWEIITVEEAKRRKSTCSYYEDEDEAALPILQPHSSLLENMHIEQLARRLPARVQGYPWRLAYSTLEHGTSLKTLYRKSAALDSPVLLVIKDMDNQIFGAYATHPFKFSDHYYGTGETFLYTFSPHFKVFKWSGENSYFINGDISSLELGGGGGRFGLWLDADLYHGRSNSCSTFNNDILSKKEDFIVQDLEVWTFE